MKKCYLCFENYDVSMECCPYCGQKEKNNVEARYLEKGVVLINRYLIGMVVGAGGFGITYAAWDKVLEQRVAVKEFLPGEFSTRMPGMTKVTVYGGEKTEQFEAGKEKFLEESRRLAKVQKIPGIVQVYNSFQENGTVYIVMEYLEGETLEERLKREHKITEKEAVGIMLPVLQALEIVHGQGILHRDIAPNNIFLTREGEVKLLDFGAARSATGTYSKSLTVLYKEGYTAEEQYRSRGNQGTWTDVYACAATLYRMLTGNVPLGAMERRRKDTLKKPSKVGANVSHGVDVAIMNAMNVDAEHRTKNVNDFLKELTGEKAKKHYIRTVEREVGTIPVQIKMAMGVLLVIMLCFLFLGRGLKGFGFSQVTLQPGKTRVPNIVNFEIEEAKELLNQNNLNMLITGKEFSKDIPENRILKQEQRAGGVIERGEKIKVIVSAGPNSMSVEEMREEGYLLTVPDVQYKDRDEAIRILRELEFEVIVEYETTGFVEGGKVISQSMEAGDELVQGEQITITVEDFVVDWTDLERMEEYLAEELNITDRAILASDLLQMQRVDVTDVYEKDWEYYDISPLFNCLNLDNIRIDEKYLDILAESLLQDKIKILNLYNYTGEMADYFIKFPKLNRVVLEFSRKNTNDLSWVEKNQNIKSLSLRRYFYTRPVPDLSQLKNATNIEQLSISSSHWMGNREYFQDVPEGIIDSLKHLELLDYVKWLTLTVGGEIDMGILNEMYSLEEVSLYNIENTLFERVENLTIREIYINRCENLDLQTLLYFKNLESITLHSQKQCKDLSFLSELKHLRKLWIMGMEQITLDNLKGLTNLEELYTDYGPNPENRIEELKRIRDDED